MKTYITVTSLREKLDQLHEKNQKLAFVPTMGALHNGHLSLIKSASQYASKVCASIFVNPTQFNNPDDLAKYPRALEEDKKMLSSAGCNYLFAPTVDEIYPKGISNKVSIDLKGMDKVMEGQFRPGHFEGMLQVVKRLLDIVQPQFLVMGQKDYQQFSLVNQMIIQLKIPTQLIIAPTIREEGGLAMSSRNQRLTSEMRIKSAILFKALSYAKENIQTTNLQKIIKDCTEKIALEGLKPEYFEIVDATYLSSVKEFNPDQKLVACVAAWAGEIRLIDNIIL
ncbi:MAG: pantoate--beta-alanine ligase [Saprospiraceae bacterium]|nr:pantoate--beta-alanine ligase [Saprospiraceae bacterium]